MRNIGRRQSPGSGEASPGRAAAATGIRASAGAAPDPQGLMMQTPFCISHPAFFSSGLTSMILAIGRAAVL